jgi:hypothetical protein
MAYAEHQTEKLSAALAPEGTSGLSSGVPSRDSDRTSAIADSLAFVAMGGWMTQLIRNLAG